MKKYLLIAVSVLLILFSCEKDPVTPEINKPVVLENLDNFEISALAVDGTNTLWIASDSGLFVTVPNGYSPVNLDTDLPVTALAYENNNNIIWAGTKQGLYQIIPEETDTVKSAVSDDLLSNNNILDVYIDENSVRWIGTKIGFTRNEGDSWQKDNFKNSLNGDITNLAFYSVSVNSIGIWDGDYYFATAGNKLWRTFDWNESVDAFSGATMWDFPYNGFAITDTMYAVFIDTKGQQWFGGTEGVQVHIGHNSKSDNTSYYDELVDVNVHCIAEAPNGDIWCGTENGISVFNGTNWNTSTEILTNNFVTAITFQGNIAWIGTKKGLNKIPL